MKTDGVEFVQHRHGGYLVHMEAHQRGAQLTVVWYEATRDDGLHSHVQIPAGPYESRTALVEAIEASIDSA